MLSEPFIIAFTIYVLVELTACFIAGVYALRATCRYLRGTFGEVPELFGRGRRKRLSRQREIEHANSSPQP